VQISTTFLLSATEAVGFDELDGAVSAGGNGLSGCASEPVNHRAARDQAEKEWGVQQRELVDVFGEAGGEGHDDGENHGGGADYSRADEDWFGRGFEGVARTVVGFEQMLGAVEVDGQVEILLDFGLYVGNLLDERKLEDGLSVVSNRTVGIDGDGDGTHAEESERDQTKSEYGWGEHGRGRGQAHGAEVIGDGH